MKDLGTLYIVATPIGNLGDMSARAIQTLQEVDCILAEDTRHSSKLLHHFQIDKRMISFHEHNEDNKSISIIDKLKQGHSVALISDAGTPLISDPGYTLVKQARTEGITVSPIPGPCALITALCVSGLPSDRFVFEGFLPAKSAQRQSRLESLKYEQRTLIFYESVHRIQEMINDLLTSFGGEREAVIAREMTKTYETILQASLSDLQHTLLSDENQSKGEFVVIVQGHWADAIATQMSDHVMHTLKTLLAELPLKQAVKIAAEITGIKKNELYDIALKLKSDS